MQVKINVENILYSIYLYDLNLCINYERKMLPT